MSKKKQNNIIDLFKNNDIDLVKVDYNAGGDSINNIEVEGYYFNNNELKNTHHVIDITVYNEDIIDLIYDNVDFYEVSDGYYMGESGTVEITYDEEENSLIYTKNSCYEYSELYTEECNIPLTKKEVEFYEKYIKNIHTYEINSLCEKSDFTIIFKNSFFINTENKNILNKILEKVNQEVKIACKKIEEILRATNSNDQDFYYIDEIILKNNTLSLDIKYYITEYRYE